MTQRFRSGRIHLAPLLFSILIGLIAGTARADFPFITQKAETADDGALIWDIGAGYREEARDFGVPDRESQWNIGTTRVSAGLGELVEVQATGVLLQYMDFGNKTDTHFGDWVLGTKIRLATEGKKRPAIGMLWEVKLPIASNNKGAGTDETDFYGYFLFSKNTGDRNRFDANIGIGVLGDPSENSGQVDIMIVRLAWRHQLTEKTLLGLEFLDDIGFEDDADEAPTYLSGIYERAIGRWSVGLAAKVGFNSDSDDYAVDLNFKRGFRMWQSGQ